MCTASGQFPASASTNQGPEQDYLIRLKGWWIITQMCITTAESPGRDARAEAQSEKKQETSNRFSKSFLFFKGISNRFFEKFPFFKK